MDTLRKCIWVFSAILLVINLQSCSKKSTNNDEGEKAKIECDGIWFGSFIVQPEQQLHMTFALIGPEGESFFGIYDTTYFDFVINLHGWFKTEKELIKGTLDVLTLEGKTGEQVQIYNGKIVSTMFEGKNVRGLVTKFLSDVAVLNGSGDLSRAADDPVYNIGSCLASVAGSWTLVEEDGVTTITITNDGKISGGTNWALNLAANWN